MSVQFSKPETIMQFWSLRFSALEIHMGIFCGYVFQITAVRGYFITSKSFLL